MIRQYIPVHLCPCAGGCRHVPLFYRFSLHYNDFWQHMSPITQACVSCIAARGTRTHCVFAALTVAMTDLLPDVIEAAKREPEAEAKARAGLYMTYVSQTLSPRLLLVPDAS